MRSCRNLACTNSKEFLMVDFKNLVLITDHGSNVSQNSDNLFHGLKKSCRGPKMTSKRNDFTSFISLKPYTRVDRQLIVKFECTVSCLYLL